MNRTTISLAVYLIATTTACRTPEPAPQILQVCDAMSAEEWQYVRGQPLMAERSDVRGKLGPPLAFLVAAMERTARGDRVRSLWIGGLPRGCYPARVMVSMLHTGVDVQPIYDLGFVAISHRVQPHRVTIASGWISPARLLDLASLPFVVTVEAPATLSPESTRSRP